MLGIKKKDEEEKKTSKSSILLGNFLDDYFGLIMLTIVLLVFVGSYLFFLFPRFLEAGSDVRNAMNKVSDERQEINRYIVALKKYQNEYESISPVERQRITELIGKEQNVLSVYYADLAISLREIMRRLNIASSSIQIGEGAKVKTSSRRKVVKSTEEREDLKGVGIIKIKISISAGMSYSKVKELLVVLENKLRIIDIETVKYNPEKGSLTLAVNTYYKTGSTIK